MDFAKHSELKGLHSFLSPSNYHWLNYDDEKLLQRWETAQAARMGTELHDFAQRAISLGIKLPRTKQTLNQYVNDAIGFNLTPEQPLIYSQNCFGTADAIGFKRNLLRVHDLKTGVSKTSELQLYIYAALFNLEYGIRPGEIRYECRIYQNDDVRIYIPEASEIALVMDKIVRFDKVLQMYKDSL